MSYVCLRTADILPRGSKNNVLQWFVQFLPGLPVPIHMASFCWGRRCPFVGATENTSGWPGAIPGHPEETVLKVKHPSVRIENPLLALVKGYGVFQSCEDF